LVQEEFKLKAHDGTELYGRSWVPDNPRVVTCLVHGMGEHIGRYHHLASNFTSKGIAVFGIDQRGHGHNPGTRGHARCQSLWDDLESLMKFVRIRHLETPMFLYGHSWGGNIVSNFLLRRSSKEIAGAILSSPWLRLSFEPGKFQLVLADWMSKIFPSLTQANGLKPEFLSRDPAVGAAYMKDPLVHDKISAGLFSEAVANGNYALRHAVAISKPTLVFHGTDDSITSTAASQEFAGASEQIDFKSWPEMRHESHNELGKELVMEFTIQWINDQVG